MLQGNLRPNEAVQCLQDRVKRINKINTEIADWLQVRSNAPAYPSTHPDQGARM